MSLFSDRELPRRVDPEPGEVPVDTRQSLIDWLHDLGVETKDLWKRFKHEHGYGEVDHAIMDVKDRFEEDAGRKLIREINDGDANGWRTADRLHWVARGVLSGLPTPLFLDMLEIGLGRLVRVKAEQIEAYGGGSD